MTERRDCRTSSIPASSGSALIDVNGTGFGTGPTARISTQTGDLLHDLRHDLAAGAVLGSDEAADDLDRADTHVRSHLRPG